MQARLLSTLILSVLFTSIQAQNKWTEKSGIPLSRYLATGFSIGNYGFVGTGGVNGRLGNDFWRYNPESDSWTEIDSMPTLGRRGAFSFSIGNKGYVGGGVNSLALTDDEFWEYDTDLLKWSRKANMPSGLVYTSETLVGFSIGTYGYFNTYSKFFMYNPDTDLWSKMEKYPGPNGLYQIGFSIGSKGYLGGGFGNNKYHKEFWEYDPTINQWSRKADLPGQLRSDAVGFSVGNYGYYGLGQYRTDILFDFWEYHPLTDTWMQIDSCGYAAWYARGIGIGSKGYMGTGVRFSPDSGWWEYSPNISSVNDIGQSEEITIFPNPTSDKLYFDSNGFQGKSFSIYSVTGQLMQTGLVNHNAILVAELPEGVYFLKLLSRDQPITLKFLKE